jgi:hypothetical protein
LGSFSAENVKAEKRKKEKRRVRRDMVEEKYYPGEVLGCGYINGLG